MLPPSIPTPPRAPSFSDLQRQQASVPQQISEEDQRSALSVLAGGALSGLGAIGGALDKITGSRALRGVLAGKPRELMSIIPFSDTLGITDEQDITQGKEITGWDNPDSWWDDIGNLGVEMVLDPTLPFTGLLKGGLTGGGKALKKLGALQDVDDALHALKGANKFSPRTTRATTTVGEGIDAMRVGGNEFRADSILDTLKKDFPNDIDDILKQPIGSSANFLGSPVNIPGMNRSRDAAIDIVRRSRPGTWVAQNLDAASKELKSAAGQMFGRGATREENRLFKDLAPAVEMGQASKVEYDNFADGLRKATPDITDDAIAEAARAQGLEDFNSIEGKARLYEWLEYKDTAVPEKYQDLVNHMRTVYDRLDVERRKYGRGRSLMDDTIEQFAHRSPIIDESGKLTSAGEEMASRQAKLLGSKEHARTLRGVVGGTGALVRMLGDPDFLNGLKAIGVKPGHWKSGSAKADDILAVTTQALHDKYGDNVLSELLKRDAAELGEDAFLKKLEGTDHLDPDSVPSVKRLAETILGTPENVLKEGFYQNPIESFGNYIRKEVDTVAAMRAQSGATVWGVRAWKQASDKEKAKYGQATVNDLFAKTTRPGSKEHVAATRMRSGKSDFLAGPDEYLSEARGPNPFRENATVQMAKALGDTIDDLEPVLKRKVDGKTVEVPLEIDNMSDWLDAKAIEWDEANAAMPTAREWDNMAQMAEAAVPGDKDAVRAFVKERIADGMDPISEHHGSLLRMQEEGKAVFDAIGKLEVPKSVIEDVRRWDQILTMPESLKEFQGAWSSLTTLFKAGVLTFPARYTRDFYSAQVQAMLLGHWSPKAMFNAARFVSTGKLSNPKQYLTPLASHIPGLNVKKIAAMSDDEATEALRSYIGSMDFTGSSHSSWAEALQEGVAADAAKPNRSYIQEALNRRPGQVPLTPQSVLGRMAPDVAKPASWNPFGVQGFLGKERSTFIPYRIGEAAGNFTDASGRVTMFLDMAKKGFAPDEIISTIKKSQVDYSLKNMTSMERHLFSQLFPFWRFSKNMFPFVLENIFDAPAGPMGQAIRRAGGSPGGEPEFTPEHIRQGMALPLRGWLGSRDPERQRYLTGLGLMHEDIAQLYNPGQSVFDTARGTAASFLGKLNPMIKTPFEVATGTQIFSQRRLEDLESGVGRMLSNVGKTTGIPGLPTEVPKVPILVDQVLANSPVARAISTTRTLFDPSKGAVARGVNVLTGGKLSDVDMEKAKRIAIREEIEHRLRGRAGISTMRPNLYRDKRYTGDMSEIDQLLLDLYKSQRLKNQTSR